LLIRQYRFSRLFISSVDQFSRSGLREGIDGDPIVDFASLSIARRVFISRFTVPTLTFPPPLSCCAGDDFGRHVTPQPEEEVDYGYPVGVTITKVDSHGPWSVMSRLLPPAIRVRKRIGIVERLNSAHGVMKTK